MIVLRSMAAALRTPHRSWLGMWVMIMADNVFWKNTTSLQRQAVWCNFAWDDIFIPSGMSYPYRYGINSLLLNLHGRELRDAELVLGVEPRKDLCTPWFEIDRSDAQ